MRQVRANMTQSDMTNYSMGFQSLGDDMRTTRLHYIYEKRKCIHYNMEQLYQEIYTLSVSSISHNIKEIRNQKLPCTYNHMVNARTYTSL